MKKIHVINLIILILSPPFAFAFDLGHDIIESQRLGGIIQLKNTKNSLALVCWDNQNKTIEASGSCHTLAIFEYSQDLNASWSPRLIGTTYNSFLFLKAPKKWKILEVLKLNPSITEIVTDSVYKQILNSATRGFQPSLMNEKTGAEIYIIPGTDNSKVQIVEKTIQNSVSNTAEETTENSQNINLLAKDIEPTTALSLFLECEKLARKEIMQASLGGWMYQTNPKTWADSDRRRYFIRFHLLGISFIFDAAAFIELSFHSGWKTLASKVKNKNAIEVIFNQSDIAQRKVTQKFYSIIKNTLKDRINHTGEAK